MSPWIILIAAVIALSLGLMVPRWRLKRALAAPFPEEWAAILENNIGVYRNLPMTLRHQLRLMIKQFLHQKHFSGAGGLDITDEIRITIAAQACMLQLNRNSGIYPGLKYIIVYPSAFVVSRQESNESGVVSEARKGLLGESWQNGKVILQRRAGAGGRVELPQLGCGAVGRIRGAAKGRPPRAAIVDGPLRRHQSG
jgi:Mlc titration factor MtfA (ptsG expression regulator)